MTTTAYHREQARQAEKSCEWGRAADEWQTAIDKYPRQGGQLAKRDLENMQRRLDACLASYFPS